MVRVRDVGSRMIMGAILTPAARPSRRGMKLEQWRQQRDSCRRAFSELFLVVDGRGVRLTRLLDAKKQASAIARDSVPESDGALPGN